MARVPVTGARPGSGKLITAQWTDLCYGATLAAGYGNVAVTMPAPTAAAVTLSNGFVTAPDDLAAKDPINIPGFVTITSIITLENSLGEVSTRDVSTDTRTLVEVVSGQGLVTVSGNLVSGMGLHSFPFPLNLSILCPFPLNFSLLCPPYNPN